MKKRFVVALPIALAAVWLLRDGQAAQPEPEPEQTQPAIADTAVPDAPTQEADAVEAPAAGPTPPSAPVVAAERPAVVVAIQPHDEVPSLPLEGGPAPENDPIAPELEQTPEWRLEKTTHIATLLDRQLERLDGAVASAEAAGDDGEARRLRIMAERQRQRLAAIHAEVAALRTSTGEMEISSAP